MTLKEQIQDLHNKTEKFIAENPDATNVWWMIKDAEISEMRELQTETAKMTYNEHAKAMSLQAHYSIPNTKAVIFVHSKPVKVKQHLVIEDVYENI